MHPVGRRKYTLWVTTVNIAGCNHGFSIRTACYIQLLEVGVQDGHVSMPSFVECAEVE